MQRYLLTIKMIFIIKCRNLLNSFIIQTLLITEIRLPNKSTPLHLALVQWYDFKSEITPFVYGCPLLELVELYNFIEIEAIEDIVHVISRFGKTNEHFVNKYLF